MFACWISLAVIGRAMYDLSVSKRLLKSNSLTIGCSSLMAGDDVSKVSAILTALVMIGQSSLLLPYWQANKPACLPCLPIHIFCARSEAKRSELSPVFFLQDGFGCFEPPKSFFCVRGD